MTEELEKAILSRGVGVVPDHMPDWQLEFLRKLFPDTDVYRFSEFLEDNDG